MQNSFAVAAIAVAFHVMLLDSLLTFSLDAGFILMAATM